RRQEAPCGLDRAGDPVGDPAERPDGQSWLDVRQEDRRRHSGETRRELGRYSRTSAHAASTPRTFWTVLLPSATGPRPSTAPVGTPRKAMPARRTSGSSRPPVEPTQSRSPSTSSITLSAG